MNENSIMYDAMDLDLIIEDNLEAEEVEKIKYEVISKRGIFCSSTVNAHVVAH